MPTATRLPDPGPTLSLPGVESASDDELTRRLVEIDEASRALHAERLGVLAEAARREGLPARDGCGDLAAWVAMRCNVSTHRAREWATAATVLPAHPRCWKVARSGALSEEVLPALAGILRARGDLDGELAGRIGGWALPEVRRLARNLAGPSPERSEAEVHEGRYLRFAARPGGIALSGLLPTAEGELVKAAVSALAERSAPRADPEAAVPRRAALADALVELTASGPAGPAGPAATITVHVDAALLAGDEDAYGQIAGGDRVSAQTARRLACDADIGVIAEDEAGQPVRHGRTRRLVSPLQRTLITHRDQGCRFPGCDRTRFVQAHHLVHWADGGETDSDNLALLCHAHHRFVHAGGWTMAMDQAGTIRFTSPDGRSLQSTLPPMSPLVAKILVRRRAQAPPEG